MADIPAEIMANILARLPPKTVILCSCVCRGWLNLISEPEFVDQHLKKSPTCLIVHRLAGSWSSSSSFWLVFDVEDEIHHFCVRRIAGTVRVFPKLLKHSDMRMIGTIDGLVCIQEKTFDSELIHVWNPCLRELITLQMPYPYLDDENAAFFDGNFHWIITEDGNKIYYLDLSTVFLF